MIVPESLPVVRTSVDTTSDVPAASPGNSDVASVNTALVPAPRPVWQYPHDASQLCLHSQAGHMKASHAPLREANASQRATGAASVHPFRTKESPARGSFDTCSFKEPAAPKDTEDNAVGVEAVIVTVNQDPGCVAATKESAAHSGALTLESAQACGTFATTTDVGAAMLS